MKRFFSVILCVCACMLTSCGVFVWRGSGHEPTEPPAPDPTESSVPTEPTEQEGYPFLDALPTSDLGGATVVLTASSIADYAAVGDTMLDAALSARTAAVEDKYHVGVAVTERTVDQIYTELSDHASRGEYYSDLISIPMSQFARFVRAGLLEPLSGNGAIDLSAPYYSATDAFTDHGAVYGAAGAANVSAKYAYCVYFNTRLAREAGLDLYAEVNAGSWTWERFSALIACRNGTGVACTAERELINCVFTSCGLSYTRLADNVRLCDYTGAQADAVMATASAILHSGAYSAADYPAGAFAAGGCLFYLGTLADARALSDMTDSYGILPLPTGAAGEQYRSYVNADLPILCIPVGAGAHAGTVYTALNAASIQTIDRAYLSYLLAYCLRDNPSALNVQTVRAGMAYDFAYVFGAPFDDVANCTYWAVQTAVIDGRDHSALYRAYLPKFENFVG